MNRAANRHRRPCHVILMIVLSAEAAATCFADDSGPCAWFEGDELAAVCANFSEKEKEKFRQAGGLIEVRPICLPRDEWLYRAPNGTPLTHLGWPVAVKLDSVIHVFHPRVFTHSRGTNPLSVLRLCAVARSTDHGKTFHPVPWLKNSCLDDLGICTGRVDGEMIARAPWLKKGGVLDGSSPVERLTNMRGGSGGAAAAVIDGKIVVACARGVYRSDDNGKTWRLLEGAGMPNQIPTFPRWGQGPELLVHPDKGLVSLGATPDGKLLLRTSQDHGSTWREEAFSVGEPIQEPAGCIYDGKLILMPRTGRASGIPKPDARGYCQYWSDDGWAPFKKQLTNILAGERDTTDVKYNPVSKRIEAVVTNRKGGGPGHEGDNCMTINLWSIAPDDLLAGSGEWRFEGTLVRSEGREHDCNNPLELERDGMHPGGTIIDAERGVQYIYIYMGHFQGPAGIFQVTRTLNTDALAAYLFEHVNN